MKEPQLQDFGIKHWQYALYIGKGESDEMAAFGVPATYLTALGLAVWILYSISKDWQIAIFWGAILGGVIGSALIGVAGGLVGPAIARFGRFLVLKSPVAARIKLYEKEVVVYKTAQYLLEKVREQAEQEAERKRQERQEAAAARERERQEVERKRQEAAAARRRAEQARLRANEDHWMSLDGEQFEQELGALFRHLGFDVESTPKTGDQGIDLLLRKDGKTTVVQCKAHQSPVGPAIIRDLYGTMVAFGADNAVLACTGGFTKGVREFAQGKPIILYSATDIARLAEDALQRRTERGGESGNVR